VWQNHAVRNLCGTALGAGVVLCATALRRSKVLVKIDPDGVTLLDGDQRQVCRWAEVVELYEVNHNFSLGNLEGWARGEHHMLRLVDQAGRTLELKRIVQDFPRLVALARAATLAHLLPAAQAAFSDGEALAFGPLTIDRQGVRFGGARLPWSDVESFTVTPCDAISCAGAVKVRKRGKHLAWANAALKDVPNAQVLIALAQERLKPGDEARAPGHGQATAEQSATADDGRDPGSS
jgi:hypothetical protein